MVNKSKSKINKNNSATITEAKSIEFDERKIDYLRRKLLAWGRKNYEDFPWRTSTDVFHTLIAEILLQRTKAKQVVPVYLNFIKKYPNPESLAIASIQDVETIILPLGLKWRAKKLVQMARSLESFKWEVPCKEIVLKELPGVGPYIAGAYLSLHRGKRSPIVDSNIVRFYGRFFGFNTGPETRREKAVIELANKVTPPRNSKRFNYALIDFTRNVCKPKPDHEKCPIRDKCSLWLKINIL